MPKGFTAGKTIKVTPWQAEWIERTFAGDVDVSVLSLGRGNGKSSFGGAIATWALFDEAVAEAFGGQPVIPVVAPTIKQGLQGVYGAATAFVKAHPELTKRCNVRTANGNESITTKAIGGKILPLAAMLDSLQGLDPSIAIVDEVGFIPLDIWEALQLAAGKRPRNLTLGLGTRSPGNTPNALDHLVEQVRLYGTIDRFLLVDYTAPLGCLIDDKNAWNAANPALSDGYLRATELENAVKLSSESSFRVFRLNQKVESLDGWLGPNGPQHWDLTQVEYDFDTVADTYLGVDKSKKGDLSAVVALQETPDGWHAKAWHFFPVNGAIDHSAVRNLIRDLCDTYNVISVGYDSRYFVEGAKELEDEGYPLEDVPQTRERLGPAFASAYQLITTHRLTHDADPTFRSHVLSAVAVEDSMGGFMLSKQRTWKQTQTHIDSAVALGIAVYVAGIDVAEPAFSIYIPKD